MPKLIVLIEIEIEKARKRAEEEARRKAAAEAAAKAAAAKKAENKTTGGVTRSKSTEKNEDTRKAAPVEKFSLNNEDRQLSGSFERNRGICRFHYRPIRDCQPLRTVCRRWFA